MSDKVELVQFRNNPKGSKDERKAIGSWQTAMGVLNAINTPDLTSTIYRQAGEIAMQTGRPVRIQGAKIIISETQRGSLLRKRTREIEIELPNMEIL
jgi:hypothetical protein